MAPDTGSPACPSPDVAMIRILIADDHVLVRKGLAMLFSAKSQISVVGEATNGDEVLSRLSEGNIDLVLLDMNMPGLCGEQLIKSVRAHHPGLPILVLSMHNDALIAQQALAAGASGYLTKDNEPEVLFAAVAKVASGKPFLDSTIAEQLAFVAMGLASTADQTRLTSRELTVLRLLAEGKAVMEIAEILSISDKTVSSHKARLMKKMGFLSFADLVRYAVFHKLG